MAIITLSRQVAAHGDEVGAALASKLNYKFIKRKDIEKRIVELGFPEAKMPAYDERKPGFFASIVKGRDEYFNYSKLAMLEAARCNNVIIIGRGSCALFNEVKNSISIRFVADEKTRLQRLMDEFNWDEKQARQRITESDSNRDGYNRNFYNIDVADPANYHMVLNTGLLTYDNCAKAVATFVEEYVTPEAEKEGIVQVENMYKAQCIVNKLLFENKIKIEFMHATLEGNVFTLYGVSDSQAYIEQALRVAKQDLPDCVVTSSVSVVHDFKSYQ